MKLKNILLGLVVTVGIFTKSTVSYGHNMDITIYNNGDLIIFEDKEPYLDENNRTMVPIRFLAEELGYTVRWNKDTNSTDIYDVGLRNWFRIRPDSYDYETRDGLFKMDTKVVLENGRTIVPIRFITEVLGTDIHWEQVNNHGIIFTFTDLDKFNQRHNIINNIINLPYYNNKKIESEEIADEFLLTRELSPWEIKEDLSEIEDLEELFHMDIQKRVNDLRLNIKENQYIGKYLKEKFPLEKGSLSIRVFGGDSFKIKDRYNYMIEATYSFEGKDYKYRYKLF